MSQKPVPLSVRLSQQDASFIADLNAPDAITMSEKVRYLVQQERLRSEQAETFEGIYTQCNELVQPLNKRLRVVERHDGIEYSILSLLSAWLPKMIAVLGQNASGEGSISEGLSTPERLQAELGKLEHECVMQLIVLLPILKSLIEGEVSEKFNQDSVQKLKSVFSIE